MKPVYKTFANTFIYGKRNEDGNSAEQALVEYIMKADRIDKYSEAFKPVLEAIKTRQTTAILYRILLSENVVLCMYSKELSASFKVFSAKDIRSTKKARRTFIDLTGLVTFQSGYFNCKEIDKLCSYLFCALVNEIYYTNGLQLTGNATVVKSSTLAYTKMVTSIFDYLRVINYSENKIKISYIVAVFYLYNLMDKDISYARSTATSALGLSNRETSAWDIYYDYEKDFTSIDTLITFLSETFKLKGLTTDVFIDRWIYLYGKGTMYGCELLPSFLCIIVNAYTGAYVNHQKKIETVCGKDMIAIATTILQIGGSMFDKGFFYEPKMADDLRYRKGRI